MEQTLGMRVKARRRALGLSASKLAAAVGVTENAIRKIESGDSHEPRFSTGLRIAHVLKMNPALLAGAPLQRTTESPAPELGSVLRRIRAKQRELVAYGVKHLLVFGSVARGESSAESDIDVLLELDHARRFSLFDLAGVSDILQQELNRHVDVVTEASLRSMPFEARARSEAVLVF